MNKSFDYYKIGYSYDIAANIENYTVSSFTNNLMIP